MKKEGKVKMKKILGVIFTLALVFVLLSCGKNHTHSFSEEWSSDANSHWHAATCEHNTEVSEKNGHTWDGGKVTLEPTEQSEGKKTFTCTVCQYTKEEKIDKLSHEHAWVEADCDTPKTCSKCNATEGEPLGHTPAAAVKENAVVASCTVAGSYESVVYCSVCEEEISRVKILEGKLVHTPAAAVKENEVAATCSATGSYESVVYCSVCEEEISREIKTVDKLAHTPAEAVKENEVAATCKAVGSYDLVVKCSVCEEEVSRETKTVDKLAHTPAAAVKENEVAATCTAEGSYDLVVKCSVCEEELGRTTETATKLAHEYDETTFGYKDAEGHAHNCKNCDAHDEVVAHTSSGAATETEAEKCTACEYVIAPATGHITHTPKDEWKSDETHHWHECVGCSTEKVGYAEHTPAEAVKEKEVAATCAKEGSYELVVYCSECEEEISREAKTVEKLEHTAAEAVKEKEVAATCAKEGSYELVVYCSECEEEISREAKTVEKLEHTAAEAVEENKVPATCKESGSYDLVVYCSECEAELSRETITVNAEHNNDEVKVEVVDGKLYNVVRCTGCEEIQSKE